MQGRIVIKVDDIILLEVDMYSIATLAQETIDDLDAENAATLMDILLKLFNTLKNSFKDISLYRGTTEFESQTTNYKEPDVSFEFFRYTNGKTLYNCG